MCRRGDPAPRRPPVSRAMRLRAQPPHFIPILLLKAAIGSPSGVSIEIQPQPSKLKLHGRTEFFRGEGRRFA